MINVFICPQHDKLVFISKVTTVTRLHKSLVWLNMHTTSQNVIITMMDVGMDISRIWL